MERNRFSGTKGPRNFQKNEKMIQLKTGSKIIAEKLACGSKNLTLYQKIIGPM